MAQLDETLVNGQAGHVDFHQVLARKANDTADIVDFGALGDGTTDDTAAVQAAIDLNSQDVFIPEGTFLCNVTIDGAVNLRGTGPKSVLKAKTSSPVITVSERITGLVPGRRFSDFKIDGNAKASKGVLYSVLTVEDDFDSIVFDQCSRGIDFGANGPIGNRVRYCSFQSCDYGIYAKEDASGNIAVNLNAFLFNRFKTIALCAIYMDSSTEGLAGNRLEGNWFESIAGFAVIAKGLTVGGIPNEITGGWVESTGTTTPVTLDDEGSVTTYAMWILNTTVVVTSGAFPANSLIDGASVTIDHYRGSSSVASDNTSPLLQNGAQLTIDSGIFDASGGSSLVSTADSSVFIHRPSTKGGTKRGFLVEGPPMSNDTWGHTNQATVDDLTTSGSATLAVQGSLVLGSRVVRATLGATSDFVLASVTLANDKFYAYSFAVKSSTSTDEADAEFIITGTGELQGALTIRAKGSAWTHYAGVTAAGNPAPTSEYLRFRTTSASTYDISRLQFVEFDTIVEAENFVAMRQFAINTSPQAYVGSGTPEGNQTAAIGSTYMRSDGGSSTSFYVKESGSGATGWVAK